MSYLQVDDNFTENPKVEALSDRAFRLHVRAMVFCARNLTDGVVTAKTVKVLLVQTSATRKHVDELVEADLWTPMAGGGFEMHDYLDYNRSATEVKDDRRKARERMKRLRARGDGERSGEHSAERTGARSGTLASPVLKDQRPFADASKPTTKKPRVRVSAHDVPDHLDFAARAALAQARVAGETLQ